MDANLAPALILRGPRQVGKTTLQEQIIRELLEKRRVNPLHVMRLQFDDIPHLGEYGAGELLPVCRWYEENVMGRSFNQAARDGEPAFLFMDEVQNLKYWGGVLKHLVDHHAIKVVLTGSSAFRIALGQDSLAGRVSTVELDPLHLGEIAHLRGDPPLQPLLQKNDIGRMMNIAFWRDLRQLGLDQAAARDRAFAAYADLGGYPLAHIGGQKEWDTVAEQLNENIIRRVIRHDLRVGGSTGRKRNQPLLEAMFRAACRYCGQAPSIANALSESVNREIGGGVGLQRVHNYLTFLRDTLLVRLAEPMELRLKKRLGAAKICLADHSLRAAWLREKVDISPTAPETDADLAGRVAESVTGAFLLAMPQIDLHHFPARGAEPEVDFVLTIGDMRIPIEVKYRRNIRERDDTAGLRNFVEKTAYRAPFGLLITRDDAFQPRNPRIVALPLASLLLMR